MAAPRSLVNTNLTGRTARLPRTGRVPRSPQHRFQLRTRPWQIQPFLMAPVLPGETLKNGLLQARVVSDPVQNPLIGWWKEYFFYYVRLSDLDIFETVIWPALSDPTANMSASNEAASVPYYHFGSTVNWAKHCTKRIVECYFREQEADRLSQVENWDTYTLDGLPAAQISLESGFESLMTKAAFDAENADSGLTQVDVNMDKDGDGTVTMTEFEQQRTYFNYLKQMELVNSNYDQWLKSFGIKPPVEEKPDLRRPELLRHIREWTYPSNTIDPADGSPASALSWVVAERMDKDRFFREPGFIVGLTVARPKVYLGKQSGALVGAMNDALTWLPAALNKAPLTSFKSFTGNSGAGLGDAAGPLPYSEDDYVIDVRDLLIYGDQFVNFATTATDAGLVQLPTATHETRYPTLTEAKALFVDSTGASGLDKIREDGVVHLLIQGAQVDSSARK